MNCWSIAEHAGEARPQGMQRLLLAAAWDETGIQDDLRGYVLDHFADRGAVLVADETGDLKRETMTLGAQRQYTGTAGRTENAVAGVLTLAGNLYDSASGRIAVSHVAPLLVLRTNCWRSRFLG